MTLLNNRWPLAEWSAALLVFLAGLGFDYWFSGSLSEPLQATVLSSPLVVNFLLGCALLGLIALLVLPFASKSGAQPVLRRLGELFFLPFTLLPATIAGLLAGILVYLQWSELLGIFVTVSVFLFVKPLVSKPKEEFLKQTENQVTISETTMGRTTDLIELTAVPLSKPLYGFGYMAFITLFIVMLVAIVWVSQLWVLLIFVGVVLIALKSMLFNTELISLAVDSNRILLTTSKKETQEYVWNNAYQLRIAHYKNESADLTMVQIVSKGKSPAVFSALLNEKYLVVKEKLGQAKFLTAVEKKIRNTSINTTFARI